MKPERGIIFHDVPEDGLLADGNHRLGLEIAFLRDARAEPPGKNDNLHERLS